MIYIYMKCIPAVRRDSEESEKNGFVTIVFYIAYN